MALVHTCSVLYISAPSSTFFNVAFRRPKVMSPDIKNWLPEKGTLSATLRGCLKESKWLPNHRYRIWRCTRYINALYPENQGEIRQIIRKTEHTLYLTQILS